jgi:phosphatidylinositol glycan class S
MTSKTGDHESPQTFATSKATDLKPSAQRVPPPETPEAVQTRFRVIAAFWAVIIFLGFPIWWKTTSIYRAHLPIQDMADWADGKVRRAWGRENECAFLSAQFLTLIVIDLSPGFSA